MGQFVSSIKDKARETGEQDAKLADDALNSLQDLARSRQKIFRLTVEKSSNANLEVPIKKIVHDKFIIKCGVESNPEGLKSTIDELIGAFSKKTSITEAIAKSLSLGLDTLFGNYSGSTSETSEYTISVTDNGAVYRIDYYLYSYRFTSESLTNYSKNVLLACLVVSSANVADLDRNSVKVIVSSKFPYETEEDKKVADAVVEDIMKAVHDKGFKPKESKDMEAAKAAEDALKKAISDAMNS